MPKSIDITGHKFGKLVAMERLPGSRSAPGKWRVQCDCGAISEVRLCHLKSGATQSCGCGHRDENTRMLLREAATIHGYSHHPLYTTWKGMLKRCYDRSHHQFADYGGRGIDVCFRWHSFEQFADDMNPRPVGLSLERKNNEKGYSPENCCWATRVQQANNSRKNRVLEFAGKAMTVSLWARELGLAPRTLWARLDRGWSVERALTEKLNAAA